MGQTLKEGGRKLELRILGELSKIIRNHGDEARIVPSEESGGIPDILMAEWTRFGGHLDTVMAEFLFRDVPGEPEEGKFFSVVLTLREDVPAENAPELAFASAITNFYLEKGCFALNKATDMLVYKTVRSVAWDEEEERILRDCVLEMEQAREIAARYSPALLAVAEGSLEIGEFMDLVRT